MKTDDLAGSRDFRQLNPQVFGLPAVQKQTQPYCAPAKRLIKQSSKGPNKWEREFEEYLRTTLRPISIAMPQRIGLRLGNGVVYWPDVLTVYDPADTDPLNFVTIVEFWEVKGQRRPTGIAKIKIAASQNKWATFWLVSKQTRKQGGGWHIEKVLP